MKKLALALVLALAAPVALGQSVGASQIKKKTDAGLVADSANALAVGVYRGASAPGTPVTGQFWCDTTTSPCTLKVYSGSVWQTPPTAAAITQADLTSFPASPTDGMIVWARSLQRAVIYDATAASWFYLDSTGRLATTNYSLETAGYSSATLAGGTTTGVVAAGGSLSTGAHTCAMTFYNSTGGESTIGTTTGALTATGGNLTINLTVPASVTGSRGKRIWCSKTGTATPLFLVATIDDTSTTTYAFTAEPTAKQTPPTTNFSAPIPSGWTMFLPAIANGGCGSTGTSIACVTYAATTANASHAGPRLMYAITGSTGSWRVRARIKNATNGFAGSSGGCAASLPLLAAATSNDVVTPVSMRAWGIDIGNSSTNVLPITSTSWGTWNRVAAGAWGSQVAMASSFMLVAGTPVYVELASRLSAGTYYHRFGASSDGKNWSVSESKSTAADEEDNVGMVLERAYTQPMDHCFVEMDQFTWTTE